MNSQTFSLNSHLLKFISLCNDLRNNLLSNHIDDTNDSIVIILFFLFLFFFGLLSLYVNIHVA